ncbi:hypothetical protein JMJ35_000047 [Cladonia borealis]|uniref:HNH domain-containing protein n=1 Tax=Cladonia borealis TaxID=184061 RepID=A0AA39R8H0_9LECA|nr:hypothetical protein JMJ35_000047 [Cladonia borealis]
MAGRSARANFNIFLECFSRHLCLFYQPSHSGGVSRCQEIKRGKTREGFYSQPNGECQAAGRSPDVETSRILVDSFTTRLFMALPQDLRTMSSSTLHSEPYSISKIMLICSNLPDDLDETAKDYLGIPKDADIKRLFFAIISDYVKAASQNHGSCEICERHRFKLTAHHLIPQVLHGRLLKQGIYSKHQLKQVAWLCRGCHEFIHHRVKPTLLAEKYSSVDLLLRRHDVREWAKSIRNVVKKG